MAACDPGPSWINRRSFRSPDHSCSPRVGHNQSHTVSKHTLKLSNLSAYYSQMLVVCITLRCWWSIQTPRFSEESFIFICMIGRPTPLQFYGKYFANSLKICQLGRTKKGDSRKTAGRDLHRTPDKEGTQCRRTKTHPKYDQRLWSFLRQKCRCPNNPNYPKLIPVRPLSTTALGMGVRRRKRKLLLIIWLVVYWLNKKDHDLLLTQDDASCPGSSCIIDCIT